MISPAADPFSGEPWTSPLGRKDSKIMLRGQGPVAASLEKDAQYNLAMAQCLKAKALLEDLSLWVMEKTYPGPPKVSSEPMAAAVC